MIIDAVGNNIKNALACARREAGLKLNESRETLRSGGEDGLWRIHLQGDHIVQVTIERGCSAARVIG